jgi:pimeloyl-ACP methyl ester carboxylesterase
LNSLRRALRFISAQQRAEPAAQIESSSQQLECAKKAYTIDTYKPERGNLNPIVFLHGMSPLGIRDPRQVNAARALASAGFNVICPEIPEIRARMIRNESIIEFKQILRTILNDASLCPTGRFSLFAPSFSGGICLIAAAESDLREHVLAACSLGGLSEIRTSLDYLLVEADADPYARYIVLANFLPRMKKYRRLAPFFAASALDNWHASAVKNARLVGFEKTHYAHEELIKLKPAERKLADLLLHKSEFRKSFLRELDPFMAGEIEAYNVARVADRILAPVLLMHGISDDVIPARESVALSERLLNKRLVLSPFLGHADSKITLRNLRDVWRLISGFAYFFRHAAGSQG